jgi:ribonuclease P protein component
MRRGPLTVTYLEAPPPPRVAYAISRKVGGAVDRNRLRRRLRALASQTDLGSGAWLVSASPGASDATFAELAGWWSSAVAALDPVEAR